MESKSNLANFLRKIFQDANAEVPVWQPLDDAARIEVTELLQNVHSVAKLDAPAEAPVLHVESALWASQVLHWGCWLLLNRFEADVTLPAQLKGQTPAGTTASEHWSVDLLLRYFRSLIRQAKHLSSADPLTEEFKELLQGWPLSAAAASLPLRSTGLSVVLEDPCLRRVLRDRLLKSNEGAAILGHVTTEQMVQIEMLVNDAVGRHQEWIPKSLFPNAASDKLQEQIDD